MVLFVCFFGLICLLGVYDTFLFPPTAGSVFMCRLCNLFSPSHTQLSAHCSQLHPEQEALDDIIIALEPLAGDPLVTPEGHNHPILYHE